jgi:hypothetical protein
MFERNREQERERYNRERREAAARESGNAAAVDASTEMETESAGSDANATRAGVPRLFRSGWSSELVATAKSGPSTSSSGGGSQRNQVGGHQQAERQISSHVDSLIVPMSAPVTAVACHPTLPFVLVGMVRTLMLAVNVMEVAIITNAG